MFVSLVPPFNFTGVRQSPVELFLLQHESASAVRVQSTHHFSYRRDRETSKPVRSTSSSSYQHIRSPHLRYGVQRPIRHRHLPRRREDTKTHNEFGCGFVSSVFSGIFSFARGEPGVKLIISNS